MDQPTSNPAELISPTESWGTLPQEFRLLSDAELLELFRLSHSSLALNEIVRRHSPLVASVIRRLISNAQDAEDAYQATFLATALSVKKIRKPDSLAAWLYGVAYRTAKRVRSSRRKSNQKVSLQSTVGVDLNSSQSSSEEPLAIIAREFQLEAMDEELSRLPNNLREALVEHYLGGNSVPEIAQCLNLSVTAVESRLKRGRKALRIRLAMRGVSLTVVAAACLRFQQDVVASTAIPWSNRFLDLVGNAGFGTPTLARLANTKTIQPHLVKIVQGELIMKPFARSIFSTAGALLVLCSIGVLGIMSAIGNQQSASIQSGVAGKGRLAMTLPPSQELDLAETGTFVLAQGGLGDMGGTSAKVNPAKEVITKWEKPTGPLPTWLDGQIFENKREDKMRARLNDRIDFEFKNAPLSEAVEFISKEIDVPFIVDEIMLASEGLTGTMPISLRVKDARVRDILVLILEPLQLKYVILNEVVRVTSKRETENDLRFYDLSYILPDNGLATELLAGIENSIFPDLWIAAGGTSTIRILGSQLVVMAPHEVHFAIERFLFEMSKQSPSNFKPRTLIEKPTGKSGEKE